MEEITFGSLIRSLRKQNHLTQTMLAQKLGITDKAVSKWERDLSYPDICLFPKLADVLGVSVDDLLSRSGEENPSRLIRIFQMSHDIRTPLNIILGYTNLAVKYHDDPQRLLRYLRNIRVSGEYLMTVIDRLMEIARLDSVNVEEDSRAAEELRKSLGEIPQESNTLSDRYDFSGRRVLLVEDIELNREIAYEILRQTGVEVEFAEDGRVCLNKLRAAPAGYYDLILMDIQMPNMDGIDATKAIRRLPDKQKAKIPIIAMTARVYEEDRKAAFAAGMNDFTEKPILIEELCKAIQKFI